MDYLFDLFISLDYVRQHLSERPVPKIDAPASFQQRPEVASRLLIYGDERGPQHVQLVAHNLRDEADAATFMDNRWRDISTSIEVFASIVQGHPFNIEPMTGTKLVVASHHEFDGENYWPPVLIDPQYAPFNFDWAALQSVVSLQFAELVSYLFYLRRLIDTTLDIDYRWLNAYRICELRYNTSGAGLSTVPEWQQLVGQFADRLREFGTGTPHGTVEALRATVAHAVSRGGIGGYGTHVGSAQAKKIEASLPLITDIAHEILNHLPGNPGLQFKSVRG